MGLKNEQYRTIMREYEQKQLKNHNIQNARCEEVYSVIPAFRALDESVSALSVQAARNALADDSAALSSLKQEIGSLKAQKKQLLTEAGFPEDYLEPVYSCPKCRDTGYMADGQKCTCFKERISRLLYLQSNLQKMSPEMTFANFSLRWYSPSYYEKKGSRSARETAVDALAASRHFADSFGKEFDNLFFYGSVGVGKTFLSASIAAELIEQGVFVLYYSAPALFNVLAAGTNARQNPQAQEMARDIKSCDLLIIDDLGSEYTNAFISSLFFSCINERLLEKKPVIISTNLSLDSLADLYTERAFSRITSSYRLIRLIGDDIRLQKKLEQMEDTD